MDLIAQRGAVPVMLDRPRILFFDMAATWVLIQRYGSGFAGELFRMEDGQYQLLSLDALAFFLHAGIQAEARKRGDVLSLEEVASYIRPWSFSDLLRSVVFALAGATFTPVLPGKSQAVGEAAKPAAVEAAARTR